MFSYPTNSPTSSYKLTEEFPTFVDEEKERKHRREKVEKSRKSSNYQNSTLETMSERERDRQVANIKVIYETEIKELKKMIEKKEGEIKKLKENQKRQSVSPASKAMKYGSYLERHTKTNF